MITSTITSKGQITIPKRVREFLHLSAGDKVAFLLKDNEAIFKPLSASVDDVFGLLSSENTPVRSVEEMNQAIRSRARKKI